MKKVTKSRIEIAKEKMAELSKECVSENRIVLDGAYDLEEGEALLVSLWNDEGAKKFLDFVNRWPKPYYAHAYDSDNTFLLSQKPKEVNLGSEGTCRILGTGVLGCSTLIENAPKRLLILDEFIS